MIESIKKKEVMDEKGYAEFMMFNKKNYGIRN